MKLAEALLEKKNVNGRIQEMSTRFSAAAIHEEGEAPEENAADLLNSLEGAFDRWGALTTAINRTNNIVKVGDITMMEALAKRDVLKAQSAHYRSIAEALRNRNRSRMYGETTKMVLAEGIEIQTFIKKADDLAQELRLLDVAIQSANWANDLVE